MGARYVRAEEEVGPMLDELLREHHGDLLAARFGMLFVEKAPKNKGAIVYASVAPFPAKMQPFFGDEAYDYLLTVSADVWNRATAAQRSAMLDHELCHCVGEEDDDGEMTWGTVGHDLEEFVAVVRRHGIWRRDMELVRQAFAGAKPMAGGLPDLDVSEPAETKAQRKGRDPRQTDLLDHIREIVPEGGSVTVSTRGASVTRGKKAEQAAAPVAPEPPSAEQVQAATLPAERLVDRLKALAGLDALDLVKEEAGRATTPESERQVLDLFAAAEREGAGRRMVLGWIEDRLATMARLEAPGELETLDLPETPLDVECIRCGAAVGDPCIGQSKKGRGKPLPEGTYHDERFAAHADTCARIRGEVGAGNEDGEGDGDEAEEEVG